MCSCLPISAILGQCLWLGLWDPGLDLGCLLLWLYPDTNSWGLPGQPLWDQVAAGIGSLGNSSFHTANTPGCRFRCKLPVRRSDAWRDWRGKEIMGVSLWPVFGPDGLIFVIMFRESHILPCTPCGQRGPHPWRGADCSPFLILVRAADAWTD